jgi:hypothetical protein
MAQATSSTMAERPCPGPVGPRATPYDLSKLGYGARNPA